jgi:CheY-like chemotaxis protein
MERRFTSSLPLHLGNGVKRGLHCLNIFEALFDDRKKDFDALVKSLESRTQGIRVRIALRASCKQKRMSDTRLKSIKVVAVDDHPDSRALLRMILKLSSADELVVVGSGREALTAIKKVHPDVLICDLAMPEMDGYELLENVRGLESEIGRLAVIAFTAADRSEDRAATKRAGFAAHLVKPVDPNELVTTILKVAKGH